MTREGLVPGIMGGRQVLQQALKAFKDERITEARGEASPLSPALPPAVEDVPPEYPPTVKELADYYKTPRGAQDHAPGLFAMRSADLLANFDAYAFISMIAPQLLLTSTGDSATTGEDATKAAKGQRSLLSSEGSMMMHWNRARNWFNFSRGSFGCLGQHSAEWSRVC